MDLLEREDALQLASAALERASAGSGRVVLVAGEAGVGKSSFAGELVRRAPPRMRVLRGHCEDLHAPRVLGPLHDMAGELGAGVRQALDAAAPAATLFARLLAELDTPLMPSLMLIEDLHWADQATLDFVKFIGRRIGGLPLALVLSFRDDELAADGDRGHVFGDLPATQTTRIALAPLSPAGVAQLATRAGRPPEGLHEATAGNPFYVTELLASGVAELNRGLPTTVRQAVLARLARLPARERAVLDRLSVVPGWMPMWLVRALAPDADAALLDSCLARGVLVLGDAGLAFRHELARRAVSDALSPLRRRELHARAFEALSAPPAGVSVALPQRVHHAAEAGDAAQVLALAPQAAAQAAAVGAHREAALLYGLALRFAEQAPAEQRAQLHESWSYEAGLALHIDARVIEARHQAIALWREVGRADKVGHNLRWLSRLHWYQGDQALAERYADEAVAVLQPLPPGPELAWALSMRSQQFMLQDRTDLAIDWGERAIALAEALGETEICCHALNNVGTALLFADRHGGHEKLAQSLALALEGGFHEQAARVYTNVSEHAVVFKDFTRAERMLEEGIAFDRAHDLDSWTHYLVGWLAELRLAQGRFDDAERIAGEVLALPHLTLVMRLPAQTVLGRVQMRRGVADGERLLAQTLEQARTTGEAQRIVPVALALAEAAWLRGDLDACQRTLQGLPSGGNPWEAGEIAAWQARTGVPAGDAPQIAQPWRDELEGRWRAAADGWLALGAPYEAALALMQAGDDAEALREALSLLEALGAAPAVACCRALARRHHLALPAARRGLYSAARRHPHQLTAREQQVLALMVDGRRNAEIAAQLGVTPRTAERHVSEVIAKLGAGDRHEAVAIARRES